MFPSRLAGTCCGPINQASSVKVLPDGKPERGPDDEADNQGGSRCGVPLEPHRRRIAGEIMLPPGRRYQRDLAHGAKASAETQARQ